MSRILTEHGPLPRTRISMIVFNMIEVNIPNLHILEDNKSPLRRTVRTRDKAIMYPNLTSLNVTKRAKLVLRPRVSTMVYRRPNVSAEMVKEVLKSQRVARDKLSKFVAQETNHPCDRGGSPQCDSVAHASTPYSALGCGHTTLETRLGVTR